ncbi:hypothetical protein PLICBS_000054 [Purpureocillium lilacinum]|uniref:uncharacterized protein n=1 Tax=Purpureocillium lilacinum TaxID=33203 RepID=UPI00208405FE|nr:hypothetical protein PLICBS_000054 [Purpureocillium lilacinum]
MSSPPDGHASASLRRPLDSPRGAGGDMSMMCFVQPECPSRFAHPDEHRIKGLNAETLARIFLPPPAWLLTAKYAPLRANTGDSPTSVFFSLNLSIYSQSIVSCEWTEEWFFMSGRVHPYALAWEVEQQDGFESDTGDTLLYTMPALVVRDQSYQPVLPRPFASMDSFPCIPPVVSFAGLIAGPGHSLLRKDLLPDMDGTQLKCCGFIQLSTYLAPGNPDKTPFKGFHPFQVFVIFPIHANPWAILCKKMAERRETHFSLTSTSPARAKSLASSPTASWSNHQAPTAITFSSSSQILGLFSTRPPPPQPRPPCLWRHQQSGQPPRLQKRSRACVLHLIRWLR